MEAMAMDSTLAKKSFWRAFKILLLNFHTIQRRFFSTVITLVKEFQEELEYKGLQLDLGDFHDTINNNNNTSSNKEEYLMESLNNFKNCHPLSGLRGFFIYFDLLSRKVGASTIKACAIVDFAKSSFRLIFNSPLMDDFEVHLDMEGQCICETVNQKNPMISETERWQKYVFLPKFVKWYRSQFSEDSISTTQKTIRSLSLIDISGYNDLYKHLKQKYAPQVLKMWDAAGERTDPLKFIYEELAIASYLLMLWRNDSIMTARTRGFVDLGCGNGLLVYVLILEGYSGYGLDTRRRRIWSLYPEEVRRRLIEQTVDPLTYKVPDNVNWLLGNHSDELSAWIPILTASQRYDLSYFLLPCCPFELSGKRFQRRKSSISAYQDFCDYVQRISAELCGFETLKDRLKIPSTKRIAIIGAKRIYDEHDQSKRSLLIGEFISKELKATSSIQLRKKTEAVRNCTQISTEIVDKLIRKIFHSLLTTEMDENRKEEEEKKKNNSIWNEGHTLTISEIANRLDDDDRKHIKSECGGLKTLLKNKHDVFEVCRKDLVRIRKPTTISPPNMMEKQHKKRTLSWKKRRCFFKTHHPQGCPLEDDKCSFIH